MRTFLHARIEFADPARLRSYDKVRLCANSYGMFQSLKPNNENYLIKAKN